MKTPHDTLLVRQLLAPGMPLVSKVYQCGTQMLIQWRNRPHALDLEVHEDGRAEWEYVNLATQEWWELDQDADEPIAAAAWSKLRLVTERRAA